MSKEAENISKEAGTMSQKAENISKEARDKKKPATPTPVLGFISGNTQLGSAKQLTAKIRNVRSLWLLAKMTGDAKDEKNGHAGK